jgi:hypothetical protein
MERRRFLQSAAATLIAGLSGGCKANQFAKVRKSGEADMVGSHQAGAETFKPLVEQTTSELLSRHATQVVPAGGAPPQPLRICFVGVENLSSEEIGDFKDQIYECIDLKIVQSQVFQPVNKRFIDAGLMQTRLRPDQLFVPDNMHAFTAVMQQQGQPIDALLYAKLTSGTTRENKDSQKDYLLTLELVDIHSGNYDKQAATLSKSYYHSRPAKWLSFTSLKN